MFGWPVLIAWGIALVLALLILGYVAFELRWRVARLRSDADKLAVTMADAAALAVQADAARARAEGLRAQTEPAGAPGSDAR